MRTVTLTLDEAKTAYEAASVAAEFACENAETHERYCERECAAEERADEDRFEELAARLHALIKTAEASDPKPRDPAGARR